MPENPPRYGERVSLSDADFCYRHPDRPSFTLCQRCGKTVCPECQVQQPVGLLCPGCVAELSPKAAVTRARSRRALARRAADSSTPIITYTMLAVCGVIAVLQRIVPGLTENLWYAPIYSTAEYFEPWRMLTSVFTHSPSNLFHIIFNMYALLVFGRELEMVLGRIYYAVLLLISGIGGTVAVMWWTVADPASLVVPTVGASGALFGVLAATLVLYRRLSLNVTSLAVLLGVNLVIGFLPGANISWQAHLGGMIFGALTAYLLLRFTGSRKQLQRQLVLVGIVALLIALCWVYTAVAAPALFMR